MPRDAAKHKLMGFALNFQQNWRRFWWKEKEILLKRCLQQNLLENRSPLTLQHSKQIVMVILEILSAFKN